MYNSGSKIVLTLPILGKKNTFGEGLIGEILECLDKENDKFYRIQFNDGRIAVIPEPIVLESSIPFNDQ
jgi:hypothetical protein